MNSPERTENKTRRHPDWIRASLPSQETSAKVRTALESRGINTVCREARCPNRGECWDAGAATFLILGDTCTRSCGYCSVSGGKPGAVDESEPEKIAAAAAEIGCRYAVITSVTRDDLSDGGASVFVKTAEKLREYIPAVKIEFLIPDFAGNSAALETVLAATPDVLGHNMEVVRRLFPSCRPDGGYERSLELLSHAARARNGKGVKSGLMVGIGESRDEIKETLTDIFRSGATLLTVGQYLQPSKHCVPVARYLTPVEFDEIKSEALAIGFTAVSSGPLVRSSYMAEMLLAGGLP